MKNYNIIRSFCWIVIKWQVSFIIILNWEFCTFPHLNIFQRIFFSSLLVLWNPFSFFCFFTFISKSLVQRVRTVWTQWRRFGFVWRNNFVKSWLVIIVITRIVLGDKSMHQFGRRINWRICFVQKCFFELRFLLLSKVFVMNSLVLIFKKSFVDNLVNWNNL